MLYLKSSCIHNLYKMMNLDKTSMFGLTPTNCLRMPAKLIVYWSALKSVNTTKFLGIIDDHIHGLHLYILVWQKNTMNNYVHKYRVEEYQGFSMYLDSIDLDWVEI